MQDQRHWMSWQLLQPAPHSLLQKWQPFRQQFSLLYPLVKKLEAFYQNSAHFSIIKNDHLAVCADKEISRQ